MMGLEMELSSTMSHIVSASLCQPGHSLQLIGHTRPLPAGATKLGLYAFPTQSTWWSGGPQPSKVALSGLSEEQKWPVLSSRHEGQLGWKAALNQPLSAVEGMVVMRFFIESRARKAPSRPSGAMPAIHAESRGDQSTSPTESDGSARV